MSAGTGGTIAGVSQVLKAKKHGWQVRIVLADPPGSSLYHLVKHGGCWASPQSEKRIRKHRYDSIAEGIGLDRVTRQLEGVTIDDAVRVDDQVRLSVGRFDWSICWSVGLSVDLSGLSSLPGLFGWSIGLSGLVGSSV